MKDRAIALVLMAASAILFVNALSIPEPRFEPLGAGFLGRSVPLIIFVLAALVLVQSLRAPRTVPQAETGDPAPLWSRLGLTIKLFAALCLYLVLLELGSGVVGYVLSSVVFFSATALILAPKIYSQPKAALLTLSVAVGMSVVIAWTFAEFLHVSLP